MDRNTVLLCRSLQLNWAEVSILFISFIKQVTGKPRICCLCDIIKTNAFRSGHQPTSGSAISLKCKLKGLSVLRKMG